MSEIQKVAKKVLKDESEGIELLKDFFDDNFSSAIKKILDIKGKVIVTGVGKSGHIGKKFLQHCLLQEHHHILFIQLKPVMVIWVW